MGVAYSDFGGISYSAGDFHTPGTSGLGSTAITDVDSGYDKNKRSPDSLKINQLNSKLTSLHSQMEQTDYEIYSLIENTMVGNRQYNLLKQKMANIQKEIMAKSVEYKKLTGNFYQSPRLRTRSSSGMSGLDFGSTARTVVDSGYNKNKLSPDSLKINQLHSELTNLYLQMEKTDYEIYLLIQKTMKGNRKHNLLKQKMASIQKEILAASIEYQKLTGKSYQPPRLMTKSSGMSGMGGSFENILTSIFGKDGATQVISSAQQGAANLATSLVGTKLASNEEAKAAISSTAKSVVAETLYEYRWWIAGIALPVAVLMGLGLYNTFKKK